MCHASLKMALLLHKVGLVKRLMSTTVNVDRTNPNNRKAKEAKELLSDL
jgi:hypothetical protein